MIIRVKVKSIFVQFPFHSRSLTPAQANFSLLLFHFSFYYEPNYFRRRSLRSCERQTHWHPDPRGCRVLPQALARPEWQGPGQAAGGEEDLSEPRHRTPHRRQPCDDATRVALAARQVHAHRDVVLV